MPPRAHSRVVEDRPNHRRGLLQKAAEMLETRANDFIACMTSETGATAGWAVFHVNLAAGILREAAAITTQITGETVPPDKPGSLAMTVRQPAGVVLGIAPWNAPIILGVRALATSLACGNTTVLKVSEICPATHRPMGDVFTAAGFPDGAVNVITHAPADAGPIVNALIAHPAVRRISFTGSTRVCRIVAEAAARELKPVLLELGGKAPLVVLDDGDLDEAVNAAAFCTFINLGQICMSTQRVVVDARIVDDIVGRFVRKAETLPAGDPRNVVPGSLIGAEAADRDEALVRGAVVKGATLGAGGVKEQSWMRRVLIA
jgi:acyl-CoA reductase-like NAD-dependent aldehyde dehydrogenase